MRLMNAVLLITIVFAMPTIMKFTSYRKDKDVPLALVFMVTFFASCISYMFASEYVITYGNLYVFAWVAITCIAYTTSRIFIGGAKGLAKVLNI